MTASKVYHINQPSNVFFRRETTKTVAHLVSHFGIDHISAILQCAESTIVHATHSWPYAGVPKRPDAWINTNATKLMLSYLRGYCANNQDNQTKQRLDSLELECLCLPATETELNSSKLHLIFLWAQTPLGKKEELIVLLSLLGGFSNMEIALGLMKSPKLIADICETACHKIEVMGVATIPEGQALSKQLSKVTSAIYSIFDFGYNSRNGSLIRRDFCMEAIHLAELLSFNPATNTSAVQALLALMHFQGARLHARIGDGNELLTLDKQDRTLWNKQMISTAWHHFRLSADDDNLSIYHLEAGIAAQHAVAKHFEDTDWEIILNYYNQLLRIQRSPLVALHRVLVYAKVFSEQEALKEFEQLNENKLAGNYLYYAVKSDLLYKTGKVADARSCLRKAITLSSSEEEVRSMKEKLTNLRC